MVRARGNAKRTKYQNEGGEYLNPPAHREIGEEESVNAPTHREVEEEQSVNAPTLNSASSHCATGGREEIGVTIDPSLLDCSICTKPLSPPLYQCTLGHIACLSCWEKVQNKCPTCNKPIGGQNIAFEKVLESIHLPCPNAKLGCGESLSYSQLKVHTDTCTFGPSPCPIPGCAHTAISGEWRQHFLREHWHICEFYNYGCSVNINLNEEYHYYPLLGPGKDVCLLVKDLIPNFGIAIYLFYLDLADLGQNHFSCEFQEYWTSESYKFPSSTFEFGIIIKKE